MNETQEINKAKDLIKQTFRDLETLATFIDQIERVDSNWYKIQHSLDRLSEDFAQIEDYFDRSK